MDLTSNELSDAGADAVACLLEGAQSVGLQISGLTLTGNPLGIDSTVHPLLTDVVGSLNRLRLKGSFEGLEKIKQWAATLNRRSAADELSEEEVRQLLFELETAYNAFHTMLGAG